MKDVHHKTLKGTVVSHASQKTAVVEVRRFFEHPLYRKYIKRSKRYKAHDEANEYKVGDSVFIQESGRPISKEKKWVILKKV